MFFTDDDIRRIKDASTGHLLNVVQDFQNLRKSGTSYVCDCPHCKASKKFATIYFIVPTIVYNDWLYQ